MTDWIILIAVMLIVAFAWLIGYWEGVRNEKRMRRMIDGED